MHQILKMKRYVIAAVCIGIVLFFSLRQWRPKSQFQQTEIKTDHDTGIRHNASNILPGSNTPWRTKSNQRPLVPTSTVEETTRRLKETVLKRLATGSDVTVAEFVTVINEAIQATGVAPHELRISMNRADRVATLRIRDSVELKDITVLDALRTHFGRSKITYKAREGGRVDLVDITQELPDVQDSPGTKAILPSVETDIFGNDPNAPEKPDPFAEPTPTR